jgi:hypothetical protein
MRPSPSAGRYTVIRSAQYSGRRKKKKTNVEIQWSLFLRGELLTAKRKLEISCMGTPPSAGSMAKHTKGICESWFNSSMNPYDLLDLSLYRFF